MNFDENTFGRQIRVLVVDDSAFMRTALKRMIESDPQLVVVGTASDGKQALEKVMELQPEVVTMDVEMPRLNGLEALTRIMATAPRPVIMISSLTQEGAEQSFEALDRGAFDYIPKQLSYASLDIVKIREQLVDKIHAAAEQGPLLQAKRPILAPVVASSSHPSSRVFPVPTLICLGTSTGGPKALQQILPELPANLPVGMLVVQHMPVGFTGPFARRLNSLCRVEVSEAVADEPIEAGHVYIAPAGWQMTTYRRSHSRFAVRLSKIPNNTLHIPSVDVMMLSVAETHSAQALGVILTGMGADGSVGMKAIFDAGGHTIGQDEASCAVYGMPRACAELGILKQVAPLMEVPHRMLTALGCQP